MATSHQFHLNATLDVQNFAYRSQICCLTPYDEYFYTLLAHSAFLYFIIFYQLRIVADYVGWMPIEYKLM